MQILIQSCHSVKIDLGERPPILWFRSSTIPLDLECLPKVVSDFVGEQSRVHIMPISAKWKHKNSIHIGFIVFNGGVTTFFCQECIWPFRASRWLSIENTWDKLTEIPLYNYQAVEEDLI